jgi:D-isomer specific 2-hydroxyacid dehydrogenase, NAD binding domain
MRIAFHGCAASRNGVLVTNASPGFVEAVAELVFGLMVDLARGVSEEVAEYRAGRMPAQRMGVQLAGATLGVIGHGSIGARFAAYGRAVGMTLLVHDPHKRLAEPRIRQAGIDELLAASDFVVLLAVATEETRHLMNAARFAAMKPAAYFVNASHPCSSTMMPVADFKRQVESDNPPTITEIARQGAAPKSPGSAALSPASTPAPTSIIDLKSRSAEVVNRALNFVGGIGDALALLESSTLGPWKSCGRRSAPRR